MNLGIALGNIRLIEGDTVDLTEDQIRKAFEANLGILEEGLEYIDSEVQIGTGRIDTLAIDEKNRPVFIEYKKVGEFDKDALIQLMDYLSWFTKDEAHISHLEKHIKKKKPDMDKISSEIRLICVVSDVEDRVKNACYVISNPTQIWTYTTIKDEGGDILIIPRIELDNIEREFVISEEVSEDEMLKEYSLLSPLYQELKSFILSLGDVDSYMTGRNPRFRRRTGRVFATAWFTRKWISLELFVGKGAIESERFTYWKSGESDWGYVHLTPKEGIDEETKTWIKKAWENGGASS
ncbi:DUF91 domain-containing protein [Candidatus Bathyarchaeota archaeon A05DMB-3]|nr:DUF91 domain-containing protein [Candidatus Bathyarchaeota archaeon A05DMB-3]